MCLINNNNIVYFSQLDEPYNLYRLLKDSYWISRKFIQIEKAPIFWSSSHLSPPYLSASPWKLSPTTLGTSGIGYHTLHLYIEDLRFASVWLFHSFIVMYICSYEGFHFLMTILNTVERIRISIYRPLI